MTIDLINAGFEVAGGIFTLFNIRRTLIDKSVKGVSWWACAFFTLWGAWNIIFYSSLGQWASFSAGLFIFVANIVWISLMAFYILREKRAREDRIDCEIANKRLAGGIGSYI